MGVCFDGFVGMTRWNRKRYGAIVPPSFHSHPLMSQHKFELQRLECELRASSCASRPSMTSWELLYMRPAVGEDVDAL